MTDSRVSYEAIVLMIRANSGTIEFGHDSEDTLFVHVELPIPGTAGLSVFATVRVCEEDPHGRAKAAVLGYDTCKAKLASMKPPKSDLEREDEELLTSCGIKWEDR